jgi:hypothetical protein
MGRGGIGRVGRSGYMFKHFGSRLFLAQALH